MRTPISIIKSYIYAVKCGTISKEFISKIDHAVCNASEILETYIRNINNNVVLQLEIIWVQNCIEEALKNIFLSRANTVVTVKYENIYQIKADKLMLTQVIINILKNALEAIKLSESQQIYISTYTNHSERFISIKDNGCGIKEENLNKIFTPFYSSKTSGVGIGLAFCKNILEKMGAEIKCNSVYDEYTEFLIIFNNI
ncbi:hypothetical protein MIDIC_10020 [Alphaproteobacteria bacterium]